MPGGISARRNRGPLASGERAPFWRPWGGRPDHAPAFLDYACVPASSDTSRKAAALPGHLDRALVVLGADPRDGLPDCQTRHASACPGGASAGTTVVRCDW